MAGEFQLRGYIENESGTPVNGAVITAQVPNTTTVIDTTSTDPNGMWRFDDDGTNALAARDGIDIKAVKDSSIQYLRYEEKHAWRRIEVVELVLRDSGDASHIVAFDAPTVTADRTVTLPDSSGTVMFVGAAPTAHATSHENGGGDEISVAALSGVLADDQHVIDAEAIAAVEGEATLALSGDVTIVGQLDVEGYAAFGDGSPLDADFTVLINRSQTTTGTGAQLQVAGSPTLGANFPYRTLYVAAGEYTVAGSGTHSEISSASFTAPTFVGTAAEITRLATVYISGAPSYGGTVTNGPYALFVDAGDSRFDGNVLMKSESYLWIGPDSAATGFVDSDVPVGIVINLEANNTKPILFKSSAVAHGLVSDAETDSFAAFSMASAATGGLNLSAWGENDAAHTRNLRILSRGGQADNTHTEAGLGLITAEVRQHDGSNTNQNIEAGGNVWAIRARVGGADRTVWIIDEDGNYWFDGAAQTAFDFEDDLSIVRAIDLTISDPASIIRSEFDEFVHHNEADLVRLDILGDTVANGGLINGAQLSRVHNGAITQLNQNHMSLVERVDELEGELRLANTALTALTA